VSAGPPTRVSGAGGRSERPPAPQGVRKLPEIPECHDLACVWAAHVGPCDRSEAAWERVERRRLAELGKAIDRLVEALEEFASWGPDEDDLRFVAVAATELLDGDDLGIAGEAL
jgi:hypothetical protein